MFNMNYRKKKKKKKNLFLTKFGDFFFQKKALKRLHLETPLQDFIYIKFYVFCLKLVNEDWSRII